MSPSCFPRTLLSSLALYRPHSKLFTADRRATPPPLAPPLKLLQHRGLRRWHFRFANYSGHTSPPPKARRNPSIVASRISPSLSRSSSAIYSLLVSETMSIKFASPSSCRRCLHRRLTPRRSLATIVLCVPSVFFDVAAPCGAMSRPR